MKSLDRECQQNKKWDTYSDEELIALLREKKDESIMEYIMQKYKPLVRKKSNAMYLIGGENEDLIQEGMIGLFKAVRDYEETHDSSFFHFAELCINRQLYTVIEASNRKKHGPLNSYVSLQVENQENGTTLEETLIDETKESLEQEIINKQMQEMLLENLHKELSQMEQEVLDYYLDGMNYLQIADQLQKEPKSIDNALQRIRLKTKKLLDN